VASLGSPVVRFELALLGRELARKVGRGTVPDELLEEAEALWAGVELVGAALVFPWSDEVAAPPAGLRPPRVLVAVDPLAVVNVLGRARGSLLLPRWPLAAEPEYLLRSLATCDPRLAALAERTGWREHRERSKRP
jgi:hypothetical protein